MKQGIFSHGKMDLKLSILITNRWGKEASFKPRKRAFGFDDVTSSSLAICILHGREHETF